MGIVLFTIHISEKELAQPGELAHLGKFANARRIGTSRINMHLSRHSWENWNPLTRELTQLGELAPLAKRIGTSGRVGTCQTNLHRRENWHLPKELAQTGELTPPEKLTQSEELAIADRIGKVRTFQENVDTDGKIYADMAFFRRIDDKLALSSRNGTAGRTAKFGRISTARRIGICRDNWHPL